MYVYEVCSLCMKCVLKVQWLHICIKIGAVGVRELYHSLLYFFMTSKSSVLV